MLLPSPMILLVSDWMGVATVIQLGELLMIPVSTPLGKITQECAIHSKLRCQ
jgi:hypothetical protein